MSRHPRIRSARPAAAITIFGRRRFPARFGFLATAFVSSLSAASASAKAVSFTGGPSYAFPGFAPMIAGGAGAGTFTKTTSLVATPAGFSISNGSFTYTSAAADVGKSLAIDGIAFRPFNYPADSDSNLTTLTGTVTVPVGGSITGFTVNTDWAGLGSTVPNISTASLADRSRAAPAFFCGLTARRTLTRVAPTTSVKTARL